MDSYQKYTGRKKAIILLLAGSMVILALLAINAGSAELNPYQVIMTILGKGSSVSDVVIWNIRLPRVLAGMIAGAGLAAAGCVMQNNLRNPWLLPPLWAYPMRRLSEPIWRLLVLAQEAFRARMPMP